jgi:response regulator RpfG family c-di-GMP phosphodiesterase
VTEKILFVDDEPNVLQSIKRSLRKQFTLDTADGGESALQMFRENGDYAVIVSDMRMPGMNGVELLAETKKRWPDTVRIMLTGNADQQTAVDAVNHGDVFRFLNKPCDADNLAKTVAAGIRQHELITAEKVVLEKTLRGSIKALADVLSLANPEVFGRTTRYKSHISNLSGELEVDDVWQLESAAMLSQIGCVSLPADLVLRKSRGEALTDDEMAEYAAHADAGADLVKAIPRMEAVAEAIRYQEKNFDGTGFPAGRVQGEDIPLGARMLKIVTDFDALDASSSDPIKAFEIMRRQASHYDPAVLSAFEKAIASASAMTASTVEISRLTDEMVLAEDVVTSEDVLLIAKGQEMTLSARRHLQQYRSNGLIEDRIHVLVADR